MFRVVKKQNIQRVAGRVVCNKLFYVTVNIHASSGILHLALLHSNSFPKTGIQRSFETSIRNFMDACTYNQTNDYDVIDSKGR